MSRWLYDHFDMPSVDTPKEPPRCIRCGADLPDDLPIRHCEACVTALEPTMSEPARQLWQNQKEQRRASNQN